MQVLQLSSSALPDVETTADYFHNFEHSSFGLTLIQTIVKGGSVEECSQLQHAASLIE